MRRAFKSTGIHYKEIKNQKIEIEITAVFQKKPQMWLLFLWQKLNYDIMSASELTCPYIEKISDF